MAAVAKPRPARHARDKRLNLIFKASTKKKKKKKKKERKKERGFFQGLRFNSQYNLVHFRRWLFSF
jgi:hypothetical protein